MASSPELMSLALTFRLASQTYAAPLAQVREVVRPAWPKRLPRAPLSCLGALDLRGELVPVLRLGLLIGVEPLARPDLGEYLSSRMFLIAALQLPCCFVVDQVLDVVEGDVAEVEARVNETVKNPAVVGTVAANGERAWVLDFSRVLGERRGRLLHRAAVAAPP
jgi:chemotaxis signal transduction protein